MPTTMERFWAKTAQAGACLRWVGCTHKITGYGQFRNEVGKTVRAHRFIFERALGALPSKIDVMHSCDHRWCVALQHLSPGSRRHNMRDAVTKGRIATGTRHGRAKLTLEDISAIRQRSAAGETRANIAKDFGVCPQHVGLIVRGKHWKP